jgi:hypothetical protein
MTPPSITGGTAPIEGEVLPSSAAIDASVGRIELIIEGQRQPA